MNKQLLTICPDVQKSVDALNFARVDALGALHSWVLANVDDQFLLNPLLSLEKGDNIFQDVWQPILKTRSSTEQRLRAIFLKDSAFLEVLTELAAVEKREKQAQDQVKREMAALQKGKSKKDFAEKQQMLEDAIVCAQDTRNALEEEAKRVVAKKDAALAELNNAKKDDLSAIIMEESAAFSACFSALSEAGVGRLAILEDFPDSVPSASLIGGMRELKTLINKEETYVKAWNGLLTHWMDFISKLVAWGKSFNDGLSDELNRLSELETKLGEDCGNFLTAFSTGYLQGLRRYLEFLKESEKYSRYVRDTEAKVQRSVDRVSSCLENCASAKARGDFGRLNALERSVAIANEENSQLQQELGEARTRYEQMMLEVTNHKACLLKQELTHSIEALCEFCQVGMDTCQEKLELGQGLSAAGGSAAATGAAGAVSSIDHGPLKDLISTEMRFVSALDAVSKAHYASQVVLKQWSKQEDPVLTEAIEQMSQLELQGCDYLKSFSETYMVYVEQLKAVLEQQQNIDTAVKNYKEARSAEKTAVGKFQKEKHNLDKGKRKADFSAKVTALESAFDAAKLGKEEAERQTIHTRRDLDLQVHNLNNTKKMMLKDQFSELCTARISMLDSLGGLTVARREFLDQKFPLPQEMSSTPSTRRDLMDSKLMQFSEQMNRDAQESGPARKAPAPVPPRSRPGSEDRISATPSPPVSATAAAPVPPGKPVAPPKPPAPLRKPPPPAVPSRPSQP